MSLLKRVGSLKRSTNTYVVPRRAEPDNAERPKGMIRCHTTLLDDAVFTCDIDKHSFGDALLDEVFIHLDILERDYFGLAYVEDNVTKWVDPVKYLKKQFKGANTINVEFRVKFYVSDPGRLQEELTRYHFFLQVKKDLLLGRLPCDFDSIALLGSYIVQGELGDYDPNKHEPGYVAEFHIVPKQNRDLEDRIAELHQDLTGKTNAEVEYLFLSYARRMEFFGVDLFSARDHHGVELGLGVTCNGISVFKDRILITTFGWPHVQKITYKRKRFYIELRPDQAEVFQSVVGFHMETYDGCKQLWKHCIDYHSFFRMAEIKLPVRSRSFLHRSANRHRLARVERTEQQAMEANREAALRRSKSVRVVRTGSRRVHRSPNPNSGEYHEGSPSYQVSLPRRTISLGKETQRPVVHIRNGYRGVSEEGEFLEEEAFSPEVTISDDMTGQFSFIQMNKSDDHLALNFRRVSNTEQGPTEYYDERNADEERVGQVCMDDLASEGLLLIRMEPDDRGRYGFIVKGGSDEGMAVFVTKVTSQSPAALCNPPLEEGDQVLYICGKSVAEKMHDEIIGMIRASREEDPSELVLIVKPKDLSRINPTIRKRSLPQISDPGHMLRESLTCLKETLLSEKTLLHFDRLYRRKPGMAAVASKLPQNLVKNRYRDISAYDTTRVHLEEGPDYINANYINMEIFTTGQIIKYVAAQGPMQHTCKDFWQMIWEQRSTLVVMLTEVVEGGKVRCCKYWPDLKSSQEYGKYEITNLTEQSDRIFYTRQLRLRNRMSGEERRVTHMQYVDWPDHGIPGSKADFMRFTQEVRQLRGESQAPVIVHCSAGIGRTGVFILMETALCKMEVLEPIYPLDIVRIMRDQRGMLVQTPIQYKFVCQSILKAYEDDYVEIELPSRPTPSKSPITPISSYQ